MQPEEERHAIFSSRELATERFSERLDSTHSLIEKELSIDGTVQVFERPIAIGEPGLAIQFSVRARLPKQLSIVVYFGF